jgi:hypothetical protein
VNDSTGVKSGSDDSATIADRPEKKNTNRQLIAIKENEREREREDLRSANKKGRGWMCSVSNVKCDDR